MMYYPTKLLMNNINNGISIEITGKTAQDGTPSADNPIPIDCVKQGTIINLCDVNCNTVKQITLPCDLYEDDIFNPVTGEVQRNNKVTTIRAVGSWSALSTVSTVCRFEKYITDKSLGVSGQCHIWCETLQRKNANVYGENSILERINATSVNLMTDKGITNTVADMLALHGDSQFVYRLKDTVIEQYPSQLNYIPSKVSQVIQVPADNGLEATVNIIRP